MYSIRRSGNRIPRGRTSIAIPIMINARAMAAITGLWMILGDLGQLEGSAVP
jgi:hypothetical protein